MKLLFSKLKFLLTDKFADQLYLLANRVGFKRYGICINTNMYSWVWSKNMVILDTYLTVKSVSDELVLFQTMLTLMQCHCQVECLK